jgi:hypothetical protein
LDIESQYVKAMPPAGVAAGLIDTAVYSANAGRVHLSRVFVNRTAYGTISVVGNSLDMTKRSNPMRALLFAAGRGGVGNSRRYREVCHNY